MAVKMPFTGTVLDHLTKPRTDTRFCTGLLQKALPALRPTVLLAAPAATTATPGMSEAWPLFGHACNRFCNVTRSLSHALAAKALAQYVV